MSAQRTNSGSDVSQGGKLVDSGKPHDATNEYLAGMRYQRQLDKAAIESLQAALRGSEAARLAGEQKLAASQAEVERLSQHNNNCPYRKTLDKVAEWGNDRALPPHSEFVQGVRSAQQRVLDIIRRGST